jgi:hypothetical protein
MRDEQGNDRNNLLNELLSCDHSTPPCPYSHEFSSFEICMCKYSGLRLIINLNLFIFGTTFHGDTNQGFGQHNAE